MLDKDLTPFQLDIDWAEKRMRLRPMQPTWCGLIYGIACTGVQRCIHMGRYCSWQPIDTVCSGVTTNNDMSIHKGQVLSLKEDVVHVVKIFFIRLHQQYYVHKSNQNITKLKFKRETECAQSFRIWKTKGDELWKTKKYKGPYTYVNPVMNIYHRQLDVIYISALIRLLVKVELSISVAAIHAIIVQITGTYSSTYRKAWRPNEGR